MVHLFESAKICDGGSAGSQRCIGHGTVGSAQGHESVHKFVISIQRFLDRRRGKLWPSLQQMRMLYGGSQSLYSQSSFKKHRNMDAHKTGTY